MAERGGTACERFKFVCREVREGGLAEVGVGDVLFEDVLAEEESPEAAEMCHCAEALACLESGQGRTRNRETRRTRRRASTLWSGRWTTMSRRMSSGTGREGD